MSRVRIALNGEYRGRPAAKVITAPTIEVAMHELSMTVLCGKGYGTVYVDQCVYGYIDWVDGVVYLRHVPVVGTPLALPTAGG